jgi:hypothetical protein
LAEKKATRKNGDEARNAIPRLDQSHLLTKFGHSLCTCRVLKSNLRLPPLAILTTKQENHVNISVAFSCLGDVQGEDRDSK